ncbi:MAG: GNAT family N-acetyltransferase [Actinomycetes bacterium]
MDLVELTAGDLLLRPFVTLDADAVFVACQDEQIQRWTTVPSPYRREDADQFVASCPERWAAGSPTFACIEVRTGALVASADLQDCEAEQGPMIGFWVAPGARGGGIAVTVIQRLARWAFDELALPRVRWAAYVGNGRSRRVAERAGFVMEGTARLAVEQRGERRDAWMASMLPEDLARAVGASSPAVERVPGWPYEPITLRTERLLLRPFRDDDAASLLAYAQDPAVTAWDHERTPDLAAALARARSRADWSSGTSAAWAIASLDDREVLGGIGLSDVDATGLCAEAGYGLLAEARGQRYTVESLQAVTRWAFTETGLNRISLRHAVGNGASCAVARAAGYALEATMRQSYRFGDGNLHDEHLHARLRTDA